MKLYACNRNLPSAPAMLSTCVHNTDGSSVSCISYRSKQIIIRRIHYIQFNLIHYNSDRLTFSEF